MSTTVYTFNSKVLVNSANNKWLKKPEVVDYVTIGTQTWKTNNLAIPIGTLNSDYIIRDGKYYYNIKSNTVRNYNYSGWHIPTNNEFNTLQNEVWTASALVEAGFSVDEAVGGYWFEDGEWHYLSNSYQYLMGDIGEQWGEYYYYYFKTSNITLTRTSWGGEAWEGQLADNIAIPIRLIQDSI